MGKRSRSSSPRRGEKKKRHSSRHSHRERVRDREHRRRHSRRDREHDREHRRSARRKPSSSSTSTRRRHKEHSSSSRSALPHRASVLMSTGRRLRREAPAAVKPFPPPSVFCHVCAKNHWTVDCHRVIEEPAAYPLIDPKKGCWKCGQRGHTAATCTVKKYRCSECGGLHDTKDCEFDHKSEEWHEFYDPTVRHVYYVNSESQEVQWAKPTHPLDVVLWYCTSCSVLIPSSIDECVKCHRDRPVSCEHTDSDEEAAEDSGDDNGEDGSSSSSSRSDGGSEGDESSNEDGDNALRTSRSSSQSSSSRASSKRSRSSSSSSSSFSFSSPSSSSSSRSSTS